MGPFDSLNDVLGLAMPWSEAHAEAPAAAIEKDEDKTQEVATEKSEEPESAEENNEGEEEEEEEDLVDPKEVLEEECKNSPGCSPVKHHFEECVERVTNGEGSPNEDCVEEFFHLVHCATNCAAPKLWSILK